jgi:hypothetical protein
MNILDFSVDNKSNWIKQRYINNKLKSTIVPDQNVFANYKLNKCLKDQSDGQDWNTYIV